MLAKIFGTVTLVFVLQVLEVHCYSGNALLSQKNSRPRQKRTLNFYFPYNSCYAVRKINGAILSKWKTFVFCSIVVSDV